MAPLVLGKTNDRVLLADLDSTVQGSLIEAWRERDQAVGDHSASEERISIVLARLRLETLLSETVVITDAQAFDGGLVMQLASSGLLGQLQRERSEPLPLELRMRGDDPRQSLWLMYHDSEGRPREFLSSLFTGGVGLSGDLLATGSGGWQSDPAIGRHLDQTESLLREGGVDARELEQARSGWAAIFSLCDSGQLPTAMWSQERSFGDWMEESERRWSRDSLRAAHCLSPEAGQLLDEVLSHGVVRSPIQTRLTQVLETSDDAELLRAAQWIWLWFDERYRRAQAFQHDADYRGSDTGLIDGQDLLAHRFADQGRQSGRERTLQISLPPGLLDYVGNVGLDWWQMFVAEHQPNLRRWWREGDIDALARVLSDLGDQVDRKYHRTSAQGETFKSFGLSWARQSAGGVGGLALSLSPLGVLGTLLITLGMSAAERAATASSRGSVVEVTDYFDDVAL